MAAREALLVRTMVDLADTLVDEFDLTDLLSLLVERCVEAFEVDAAGLMLAAPDGRLRVMASSSEAMRVVELFELQAEEGPCLDCYREGRPIVNEALATVNGRWPRFVPVALGAGFASVHALPMRLRGSVIGALNLFRTDEGPINDADIAAAQALTDVATIAVVQHRVSLEAQTLNEQLQHALNSRISIEQAKGVLAEQRSIDMDEAFQLLRQYSRDHNRRLAEVAREVVEGTLPSTSLDAPPAQPPS